MWHIYKYEMPGLGEEIEIELPEKLHICDFHAQGDRAYMWACVDATSPLVKRNFITIGTGWEIENPHRLQFLRTVHLPSGCVLHILAKHDEPANSESTPTLNEESSDVS